MKIALGTAQFGYDYGITNRTGRVHGEHVGAILKYAHDNGIGMLDTASVYGESERVLGRLDVAQKGFRIVTKVKKIPFALSLSEREAEVQKSIENSLCLLCADYFYALLVHDVDQLLQQEKVADQYMKLLLSYKKQGVVKKIGASVYHPEQVFSLISRYDFDVIQLPLNIFDQRFLESGCLSYLKKQGVEIHVRSVFLQGLLLTRDMGVYPNVFAPYRDTLDQYQAWLSQRQLSPLEAVLSFLKTQDQIDYVVMGVTSLDELKQIINTKSVRLSKDQWASFSLPEAVVNPNLW